MPDPAPFSTKSIPPPAPIQTKLGDNSYGKSAVRVMKVQRPGPFGGDSVTELDVAIALSGDFGAVHCGDNANCLPTDTMKNTVYALAKGHKLDSIESFALDLGKHFIDTHAPTTQAKVTIQQRLWAQGAVDGKPHAHLFYGHDDRLGACEVTVPRGAPASVRTGLVGLTILKTADSAFSGFPRDKYTTLKETEDRLFCTTLDAWWDYAPGAVTNFRRWRFVVQEAMIATFANHKSKSVQHTLYDMGHAALAACPEAQRIRLSMPNKHCLLVDLSPFGLENKNEVFVPTTEPFGLIEATIERA